MVRTQILVPRRGIQNPRLSWISLHGAEHKCFDLGSKVVGLTAHVPPATTEVTTIGYTIGRKELKTAKLLKLTCSFNFQLFHGDVFHGLTRMLKNSKNVNNALRQQGDASY